MRFIMLGAGAVGGVVGGRLFEHGHDVVLVARGQHARVIASDGLTVASALGVKKLPVPVTERLEGVDWHGDEVVFMAVSPTSRPPSGASPTSMPYASCAPRLTSSRAWWWRSRHP
jgi:2-dehydropantoate 2-reductase